MLGDSAKDPHDKTALRTYAASTYDYLLDAFKKATPPPPRRDVRPTPPRGGPVALAFEHSVWTLGQVVPYLRLNGAEAARVQHAVLRSARNSNSNLVVFGGLFVTQTW